MTATAGAAQPVLRGLAFPLRVRDGRFTLHTGLDKFADDVRHLLSTRAGERVMRRTYGGGVHPRIQEPLDDALLLLMRHELQRAFATHLPDARLTAPIGISFREHELFVTVDYVVDSSDVARRTELRLT